MKITALRLRNLTTQRLHTDIGFIYEDLDAIIGEDGLMTHMLPRMMLAVEPWLRQKVTDARFWDGAYDPSHTGEVELPEPTTEERAEMFQRYLAQPNPLDGKAVVGVVIGKKNTTDLKMRCAERGYRCFFEKRRNWKKWVRAWRSGKPAVIRLRKGNYQCDGYMRYVGRTKP